LLHSLLRFFCSVKLTVVLLLALAALSAVGTLIPQNQDPQDYFRLLGPFGYRFFQVFDLFDIYHSWWFQLLIILLSANIIVCSIDRLSASWKLIFGRRPSASRLSASSHHQSFTTAVPPDGLREAYHAVLRRCFSWVGAEPGDRGFCLLAEKGRWSRLGVYTVHLSVVLLLIGGLIGSIWGYEGFVNIAEGQSADTIHLRYTNTALRLPFALRCDDFSVSFYESGQPKEYRSSLSVIEDGRTVMQKQIIVNDPLRYKGISVFQSSYGKLNDAAPAVLGKAPEKVKLRIFSRASAMSYEYSVAMGQALELPEAGGTLVVENYREQASFMGQNIGEALVAKLTPAAGPTVEVLLPLRFPSFDKMRGGDHVITIMDPSPAHGQAAPSSEQRYFTGLQVTKDPGVAVVYAGFVLMILGCFITFFMSHQQVMIQVSQDGGQSRVFIAGLANRNKGAMVLQLERLARELADLKI
jgi:cytochrome c biogenesis protein